jgi:CubicO group peptidase (beta-lactamase class C family)
VVVGRDSTLFEHAAGWADVAAARRLERSTTMMTYSMTKAVTAAAVLQLVARGSLAPDAPVTTLLDGIPYGDRLTVRHLLSQTSGIPNPIPLRWVHLPEEHASYDEGARLAEILAKNAKLRFAPGTRYAYSNISYWLLGRIVERVTGVPFAEAVAASVFRRLGLTPDEIGFVIPSPARHAKGYLPRWSPMGVLAPLLVDRKFLGGREGRWLHVKDNYLDGAAFGGIVATARAMSAFLRDQLRDDPVLLDVETRRLFFEQQRAASGSLAPMTLGWHVGEDRGARFFFKEGGGAGFHGEMRVHPDRAIASIAIANDATFDVKGFLGQADRELLG